MPRGAWSTSGRPALPRRGFTLVELLMVIAIISFLATIMVVVIGSKLQTAREKATLALIQKVHKQLQERIEAFDRQATVTDASGNRYVLHTTTEYTNALSAVNNQALADVIAIKNLFRRYFPQRYAECNSADGFQTPGSISPLTESSELLYQILTVGPVFGQPPVDAGDFLQIELADTDGNGRVELVDAWGQPLRFYRWPTRLIRPATATPPTAAGPTNASLAAQYVILGATASKLDQDPDDPTKMLSTANTNAALNTILNGDTAEQFWHTLDTYWTPLVISAGPDKTLGIYEPSDTGNFGNLAQPDVTLGIMTDALSDNISSLNKQAGGH